MIGDAISVDFPSTSAVVARLHGRAGGPPRILAGDVGHTKTLLGVFEPRADGWRSLHARSYASRAIESLESVLRDFLGEQAWGIEAACLGVAGPVIDGRCKPTDLPWEIDVASLRAVLGITRVGLLNDLVALGHGLDWLRPEDLLTLQAGTPRPGNRVIVAVGTGLGECTLVWDGSTHHPSPSEGGHSDFAPQSEWEVGLWRFLSQRYRGHVSVMRVVSGHGLDNMFAYVVSTGVEPSPELRAAAASRPPVDLAPMIVEAGRRGTCPVSAEIMARFPALLGAEAGNLALGGLAMGGVYLGGGIPPKIVDCLTDGRLLEGFHAKGRFRGMLQEVPVHVIVEPRAHLLGALRYATAQV